MNKSSEKKPMPAIVMDVGLFISIVAVFAIVVMAITGIMGMNETAFDPAAGGHGHMH